MSDILKVWDEESKSWVGIPAIVGPKPEKGVDYWTDEDKTEIVEEVLERAGLEEDMPGSSLALDATLTTEGAAADAKAVGDALGKKENSSNKVSTITAEGTDEQYPSAAAVYQFVTELVGDVDTALSSVNSIVGA